MRISREGAKAAKAGQRTGGSYFPVRGFGGRVTAIIHGVRCPTSTTMAEIDFEPSPTSPLSGISLRGRPESDSQTAGEQSPQS